MEPGVTKSPMNLNLTDLDLPCVRRPGWSGTSELNLAPTKRKRGDQSRLNMNLTASESALLTQAGVVRPF